MKSIHIRTVDRDVAMKPELNVPFANLSGTTLLNMDCRRGKNKMMDELEINVRADSTT